MICPGLFGSGRAGLGLSLPSSAQGQQDHYVQRQAGQENPARAVRLPAAAGPSTPGSEGAENWPLSTNA